MSPTAVQAVLGVALLALWACLAPSTPQPRLRLRTVLVRAAAVPAIALATLYVQVAFHTGAPT